MDHDGAAPFTELLELRQLFAATLTPTAYPKPLPVLPAQTVLFDNYDRGGEGVAYHDVDRKNKGGAFRNGDGVDIESITDATATNLANTSGVGRAVSYVRSGEWLRYTVSIAMAGNYTADIRYASATIGGAVRLVVDGQAAGSTIELPSTGAWDTWKTARAAGVYLPTGKHTLKFSVDSGKGNVANLQWFKFDPVGEPLSANAQEAVPWPDIWTQVGNAPSPRFEAMTHAFDDKLYVFGGYKNAALQVDRTYSVYDPAANSWHTLGTLPKGMAETHATPVDDGKFIYFVGGFAGDIRHDGSTFQDGSDKVFQYEVSSNTWKQLPGIPRIQGAGGAAIVDGELHFFGGNSADRVTNVGYHFVMDLFDVDAGWTVKRSMPDPKDHFSTVVLNNRIYTIGGEYGHDILQDTQSSVYVYYPKKDKWQRLADMPIPDSHAEGSTFVYDGRIIFAGGQTKQQASVDQVFAYDPDSDSWSELKNLPNLLQGSSVHVFGDKVIVALGARFTLQPLATMYVGSI